MPQHDGAGLARGLQAGERRSLARAITLAESTREEDAALAQQLLALVLPSTGRALRIGLSGAPGVGKSTLIERLGLHLVGAGHKVAVLAVDPSSGRTGGSILGDKTRMPRLSVHPQAFIRPSPSRGSLGGVTRRTREVGLLCEAAGYDVLIIETVGVGQSEVAVAGLTDLFVLLTLPHAGDELQGVKRGVTELADLIVVNKADLDPAATRRAVSELTHALHLLTPPSHLWTPRVLSCSAATGEGIGELWQAVTEYRAATADTLQARRREQQRLWFEELLREEVWQAFLRRADSAHLGELRRQVEEGSLTPVGGVARLLAKAGP